MQNHDYSKGAYFVTIGISGSRKLFGCIVAGRMAENRWAEIVRRCWEALRDHYPGVSLDAFVVMPDHVHGIVVLRNMDRARSERERAARAGLKPASTDRVALSDPVAEHGLPEVVRAFKTFSARRINAARGTPGTAVWQRGYYERIIRDEHALKNIRQYIRSNPQKFRKPPPQRGRPNPP